MLSKILAALGIGKSRGATQSYPGEVYPIQTPFVRSDATEVGNIEPVYGHNPGDLYLLYPNPQPTLTAPALGREGTIATDNATPANQALSPDFAPKFGAYMETVGDHEIQDTDTRPFMPQIPLLPGTPYEPVTAEDAADRTEIIYVA